jgi:hypothetical protein
MPIARRTILKALACAAAVSEAGPAASANAAVTPAEFAALSATLTGYPAADPALGARMMAAFATPARRSALGHLARIAAATPAAGLDAAIRANRLDGVANDLVAAWYSGIVASPHGDKLVTYADAKMWAAMNWAKPMGVCGGPFGYWANPPR